MIRVLLSVLAWAGVPAAVFGTASVVSAENTNSAMGVIMAATSVTALLFLMALRHPRLRERADVPVGEFVLSTNWTMYREEIIRLWIYIPIGVLMLLWAFGDGLLVPLYTAAAALCLFKTVRAIRAMRHRNTWIGAVHRPVLGVVLGCLPTAAVFGLFGLVLMAVSSALTWQVVLRCAIAGVAVFVAALTTLWAVPTAKD